MNEDRRRILQSGITLVTLCAAASAGLLAPNIVFAAWPKQAFRAQSLDEAIQELHGAPGEPSNQVVLDVNNVAENGAVVPVKVRTDLANLESISIYVEDNINPLVAQFKMTPETHGYISTRIKMAQTSNVVAVAKAGGKFYKASVEIKVVAGGCA